MIGDFIKVDDEQFVDPASSSPIYGSDHRGNYFKRDIDGGLLTGRLRWREITQDDFYKGVYR